MGVDDKAFPYENPFHRLVDFFVNIIDKPVVWVRENIVVPNRKEYYWYHQRFRRVPTVDECYTDDDVCIFEAEEQYKRDRKVDKYIVNILKKRYDYCRFENDPDIQDCDSLKETFERAAVNYFIKYGELGIKTSAVVCLMKQKNRMAWERRHGPIGSGTLPEAKEFWKKDNE